MISHTEEEKLIRRYLLGQTTPAEQQKVEEGLFSEGISINSLHFGEEELDYAELFRLLEHELIADYARGALTAEEQSLFEKHFLCTPKRREKLSLAQSVVSYAETKKKAADPILTPTPARTEERLSDRTGGRPLSVPPSWENPRWWRTLFLPGWKLTAYAALIAGVIIGALYLQTKESSVSHALAALNQAYQRERPLETRVSGVNYAPAARTRSLSTNGVEQSGVAKVDYVARDRAARLLLDAVAERPDSVSHHALGRFYLLNKELDKASDQLESALKLAPNDALTHNDLALVLLEKGLLAGQKDPPANSLELFAASLEQLNTALKLAPKLPEALFNRAIVYQHLSLPQNAISDWQTYLSVDGTSPWAKEAQTRLKELQEQQQRRAQTRSELFPEFLQADKAANEELAWQLFARARSRTGNLITEQLLDEWLDKAKGKSTSSELDSLPILESAGERERRRVDDHFTADLVHFYKTFARAQPNTRFEKLTTARHLVRQARAEFNASRFASAARLFGQAAASYQALGNQPEMMLAQCWSAHSLLRLPDLKQSLLLYQYLLPACSQYRYRWLQSQILNAIADNQSSRSQYSQALDYADQSRAIALKIEDTAGALRNLQFGLSMKLQFGNYRDSLTYSAQAFELAQNTIGEPRQLWHLYFENALNFLQLDLPTAALSFQHEALRLALASNWPLIICRSYMRLGMLYDRLEDYQQSLKYLQLALAEGQKIPLTEGQIDLTSHTWLQLGLVHLRHNAPQQALSCFEQASSQFTQIHIPYELYCARKGRSQALLQLGRDQEAGQELAQALQLYELHRQTIVEESHRVSFFDLEQDIYELATEFAFTKSHDQRQAFSYAEASRARSLLDLQQGEIQLIQHEGQPDIRLATFAQPLSFSDIQQRLPAETQIVLYATLKNRLLIWLVSNTSFQAVEMPISQAELRQKVALFRQRIAVASERISPSDDALGKELYNLLITPIAAALNPQKLVCIVPDDCLHELSFAALVSPSQSCYFIDQYVLTWAPSASLFVLRGGQEPDTRGNGKRLLSVGNPAFDRQKFASLSSLPAAESEAQNVAALYSQYRLLTGRAATKKAVINEMPHADVIHIAAHAEANFQLPMKSRLLLAASSSINQTTEEDGDALQAFEIYRLKLLRAPLVVLSACATGQGQTKRGEGVMSLARPFIVAGAKTVLASLWPVDSEATRELMVRFHRLRVTEQLPASIALRKAQQQMREHPSQNYQHPYFWAAFTCIGI